MSADYETGAGPCPIDGETVRPGAMEYCEHYICIIDDEPPHWFASGLEDFGEKTQSLRGALEDLEERNEVVDKAPPKLRDLFERVLAYDGVGDAYWTIEPGIETTEIDSFTAYFHRDAQVFTRRVLAEAQEGLAWLEENTES